MDRSRLGSKNRPTPHIQLTQTAQTSTARLADRAATRAHRFRPAATHRVVSSAGVRGARPGCPDPATASPATPPDSPPTAAAPARCAASRYACAARSFRGGVEGDLFEGKGGFDEVREGYDTGSLICPNWNSGCEIQEIQSQCFWYYSINLNQSLKLSSSRSTSSSARELQ